MFAAGIRSTFDWDYDAADTSLRPSAACGYVARADVTSYAPALGQALKRNGRANGIIQTHASTSADDSVPESRAAATGFEPVYPP